MICSWRTAFNHIGSKIWCEGKNETGYSNLVSHIEQEHSKVRNISSSTKCGRLFPWIWLIVMGLLPFSGVSNMYIRQLISIETIGYDTLMKYEHRLTSVVQEQENNFFRETFTSFSSPVVTGQRIIWQFMRSRHRGKHMGYGYILLTIGPFEHERSLSTDELYKYIIFTYSVCRKAWSTVTGIVGVNCSVNKSLLSKASDGLSTAIGTSPTLPIRNVSYRTHILSSISTVLC